MSQIQGISPISESRDSSDTEITRQKSEIDETEDSEERDAPDTPKSERGESERSRGGAQPVSALADHRQQLPRQQSLQQQQQQQARAGECNSLPVLVERLRSALELSCSEDRRKPQQQTAAATAPEDSGVDSEEDLRLWSAAAAASRLDLNSLEDALLADIHIALATLQETLKRVDIGALARYSASLDPPNKIHLLRLISSLLAKLKPTAQQTPHQTKPSELCRFHGRRRRNDRHTIGVSAEEVARARRWLLDQSPSIESPPPPRPPNNATSRRVSEGSSLIEDERVVEGASDSATSATPLGFDKCMKDAINHNQQQSRRDSHHSRGFEPLVLVQNGRPSARRYSSDHTGLVGREEVVTANGIQQRQSRPNKFSARRSKIKRANTIDIPNYLALNKDYGSPERAQNGCYALRRPIDVSDRPKPSIGPDQQKPVPSFEPKTDSDRKFLALISKNSEQEGSISPAAPFKSFNYKQASNVADRNWNNRFSIIKTNFDKPNNDTDTSSTRKKSSIVDVRKKFENRDNSLEREGIVAPTMGSVRAPKQKENGFTHASTSPFQRIEKAIPKPESVPNYLKAGYLPKNSGMLQAKLKMFDQDASRRGSQIIRDVGMRDNIGKSSEPYISTPYREKRPKEKRMPMQNQEGGDQNYYSFCKQLAPFSSGRTGPSERQSNIDATKSKLLTNINKVSDGQEIKESKPKEFSRISEDFATHVNNNCYDFVARPAYQESYDNYRENACQNGPSDLTFMQSMYAPIPKVHARNSFQVASEESEFIKPEKPPRRFETPTQNVAVQTTHELNRRRSVPEILHPIANPGREDLVPRTPQHNAAVQTSSPTMKLSACHADRGNILNPSDLNPTITMPRIHQNHNSLPLDPSSSSNLIYSDCDRSNISKVLPLEAHNVSRNYMPYQTTNDGLSSKPYDRHSQGSYPQNFDTFSNDLTTMPDISISQRLYDEFSRLPDVKSLSEFSKLHQPCESPGMNIPDPEDKRNVIERLKPSVSNFLENKPLPDLIGDNIQNQDISPEGIVTRYTCAIATVSSKPESPELSEEVHSYEPVVPRIKEPQPRHFAETTNLTSKVVPPESSVEDVKRHNMLQQSLIRRMQKQNESSDHRSISPAMQTIAPEIAQRTSSRSPTSPRFGQACMLKALNEGHKAQEKISMFEDRRQKDAGAKSSGNLFRPVNSIPRLNVEPVPAEGRSPLRNSPIDSSDEYLMSCANRPSRNIVLSKSESWHQLAMARTLQPPPSNAKPPKPKSPARLSKQFEASLPQDNARKMEEKIQRYFQGSSSQQPKEKRNLRSKADRVQFNSLSRSRTMPHLYDDRLLDDNVDVDVAFDSIFKEATRSDARL